MSLINDPLPILFAIASWKKLIPLTHLVALSKQMNIERTGLTLITWGRDMHQNYLELVKGESLMHAYLS